MNNGTPSDTLTMDGRYIQLQTAVLRQLPRPREMDTTVQDGWINNGKALCNALAQALLPPASSLLKEVKTLRTMSTHYFMDAGKQFKPKEAFNELADSLFIYPDAEERVSNYAHPSSEGHLRVLRPTTDCSFMETYLALGARKTVEWADMYQYLKAQISGKKGPFVVLGRNYFCIDFCHHPGGTYLFSFWRDSDNKRWMLSRTELTEGGRLSPLDRIFVRQ